MKRPTVIASNVKKCFKALNLENDTSR